MTSKQQSKTSMKTDEGNGTLNERTRLRNCRFCSYILSLQISKKEYGCKWIWETVQHWSSTQIYSISSYIAKY